MSLPQRDQHRSRALVTRFPPNDKENARLIVSHRSDWALNELKMAYPKTTLGETPAGIEIYAASYRNLGNLKRSKDQRDYPL